MVDENAIAQAEASLEQPIIHKIGAADLWDALAKGLDDFNAKPSHLVFLYLIYPLIGLVLVRLSAGYAMLPLVFPLMSGFTLVGPLAAIGLYELSRRRELGLDLSLGHLGAILKSPSITSIALLSLALLGIFLVWLGVAQIIYVLMFGDAVPESILAFARQVFTTSAGWGLIVIGSGVGFGFAVVVLTISVVSFPMLLDRDVGLAMAVRTSIRAVLANPVTMAMWGCIIAGALVIGALPLFLGLTVVLPVLGHATWHLYRGVVEY
jgi:uncharacterized membrane protein